MATVALLIYLALMALAIARARAMISPRLSQDPTERAEALTALPTAEAGYTSVTRRQRGNGADCRESRAGATTVSARAEARLRVEPRGRSGQRPQCGLLVAFRGARWTVPAWWLPGALCIHRHESTDWHIVNPPYSGGMQFTAYTWQSVGGQGIAAWASPAEQLYRAWLVWRRDGGSWREWPNTSRMCGLR